jgi:hypothetical protein
MKGAGSNQQKQQKIRGFTPPDAPKGMAKPPASLSGYKGKRDKPIGVKYG